MRLRFGGLAAAILLCAGPAAAADRAPPLRTEAISVTPPDGWVVSTWKSGPIELGEFRPKDASRDHTDLLDYTASPPHAGAPMSQADIPAYERRVQTDGCRLAARREVQHRAGWYADQRLCVGLTDPDEPGIVELEFAVTRVGAEAAYRVWRSWTGTPAELSAMLKARAGKDLSPVAGAGATQKIDPAAFDAAIAALMPIFGKDLERAEICDLKAPATCRAFKDALPPEATQRLRGTAVAGLYAKGLGLISRDEFRRRFNIKAPDDGTPNQAFIILEPGDLDWSEPDALRRVIQLVGGGQGADGGSLVLSDPKGDLSPEARAQLRARVLTIGRALWREGLPPDIIAFRIPAAD